VPDFIFAATDSAGNNVQGKTTAIDMASAVVQVAAMGYSLLQIELAAHPQPTQPTPFTGPQVQSNTIQMGAEANRQTTVQMDPISVPQSAAREPQKQTDLLKADAAQRMKVEKDLTRLGMRPDEIRRLVNASATTFEADPNSLPILTASPAATSAQFQSPSASKSKRVSASSLSSLESFAAQLNSASAAKSTAAVREVHLDLPPFRESSVAESVQAEALLRDASMMRRREKFKEAELKVREAIVLTPKDGAALELLGDILQGVGRVDEALAAYKRATEADSKRANAERKYGDLLMRQQNWNFADPEAVAPNRWLNSILSLLPGVGQAFNGDWAKAATFFILDVVCILLLFYSPWAVNKPGSHVRPITLASFALTIVTYIAAVMDSNISAARKRIG
jgi:tetratricopeptide (TPR) repeat protein